MPTSLAVFGFLLGLFLFLLNRTKDEKRRNLRGSPYPPGPKPLPLIGNIFDIPVQYAWIQYAKWTQIFGDLIYLHIFGQHIVVINSVDVAFDLLDKKSKIYSDRPKIPIAKLTGWDFATPLLPYGERWRIERQIHHQSFRSQTASSHHAIHLAKIHDYLRLLLQRPEDFEHLTRSLSTAIIMKVVYGYDTQPNNDRYVQIAEEAISTVSSAMLPGAMLFNVLPILQYLPEWFPGAGFRRVARTCREAVEEMQDAPLNFTKAHMDTGTPCIVSDLLENANIEGDAHEREEIIKCVAATAYAAGADTSVASSHSAILAIVLHPGAVKKAQAEIDGVVGTSRLPIYSDRPLLPYVEAFYREVMRWRPALSLGMPHATSEDDIYNGYHIPNGTIVLSNIWAMTHDERRYEEPNRFNPDRYFTPDGTLNDDDTILGFGFGRRVCVGRHLAEDSVWGTIVSLLAAFDITKAKDASGNVIEVEEKYTGGLVSHPVHFVCSITPRSEEAQRLVLETALGGN